MVPPGRFVANNRAIKPPRLQPADSPVAAQGEIAWPESASAEAIEPAGGAGEQRGLLGRRTARGNALEGVPEYRVAAAPLVDREVALEHRALRAKGGDA